jgi:DNA-binding CsgD family transcriptional regulator
MSWKTLDPNIQTIATRELTRKQLDVLKLHLAGCGTRRIATMLDISEPTAREHLRRARAKLRPHLEKDAA